MWWLALAYQKVEIITTQSVGRNWDEVEKLLFHVGSLFHGDDYKQIARLLPSRNEQQTQCYKKNFKNKCSSSDFNKHHVKFEKLHRLIRNSDGTTYSGGSRKWDALESLMFEAGFILHGDDYRRIAQLIPSRTDEQVQRYMRTKQNNGELADLTTKHDKMRRLVVRTITSTQGVTTLMMVESVVFETIGLLAKRFGLSPHSITNVQVPTSPSKSVEDFMVDMSDMATSDMAAPFIYPSAISDIDNCSVQSTTDINNILSIPDNLFSIFDKDIS